MKTRAVPAGILILLAAAIAAAANPPEWDDARYLPLDAIRPGMTGVGHSVFEGAEIDTFGVHVLGVLRTAVAGGDIILARLSGQGLERSGVIAGMSGSPVYVDGKLIGAVALGWSNSLDPIAGITPIASMLALGERAAAQPGPGAAARSALDPAVWERLRSVRGAEAWDLLAHGSAPAAGWTPLALPVAANGLGERARGLLEDWLGGGGFVTAAADGGAAGGGGPLRPGDAVGVELARGDAHLGAIGTVTWTDGERVLAFGHRMLNLGAVAYPMTRATIFTVLPRRDSSFKMGATGETLGAITRDYRAGVMGEYGATAAMIPMTVNLSWPERETVLRFELLDSDLLTPSLAGLLAFNAVDSYHRGGGPGTLRVTTRVSTVDGRALESASVLAGFSPPGLLAGDVARLVGLFTGNPFEAVRLASIDVDVRQDPEIEAAFIERISVPAGVLRPGDTVPVDVLLRDYRAGETEYRTRITLPGTLSPGKHRLVVCGGGDANRLERERAPERFRARNLDQALEQLREDADSDELVLQLLNPAKTPVVAGRELPGLPPSLSTVLDSPRAGGRTGETAVGVTLTHRESVGKLLLGCRHVDINVEPRR